jgi:8-oxo-(d)GTP phosphatase
MKVFINDKPVEFIQYNGQSTVELFDTVLWNDEVLIAKKLVGNVLINNMSTQQVDKLIELMELKKLKKLLSLTISLQDYDVMTEYFKDHFKIIKAAGGLVRKADKVLLIYRLKRWDLPKGKLKKGEDAAEGAKREVEEECNVKVMLKGHLLTTWHTYVRKNRRILKRTDWYTMNCLDDSNMQPQLEEFIEEVKWMGEKEVVKALTNTYHSIEEVFKKYFTVPSNRVG